ncbi:MAG TPA: pitrilysin family protein [Bacteroidota bacterium]|jgi:zinc protease|nr:pitrilysin family protein [Bacteroidota bacterium]
MTIRNFTLLIISVLLAATLLPAKDAGMKFTEMPSAASPLITFRVIIRAGAINDPAGKEGLNALTAEMIAQGGTKELTYTQVVDKMYPWAAGINANSDQEVTTFIGNVHRDNLDAYYKLISSLLLQPRFDPADFQRIKDMQINYLKNTLRSTNDEALGKQTLNTMIYAGHPYGKTEAGTVQGITSITLEDVKAYYAKTYTQANIWIGIAGGYPATLVETMRKDFAALPAGQPNTVTLASPPQVSGMEVTVVEKPTRAYAVSMGYPVSVTRKDKDFYPLLVAGSYFGEHRSFNGVLMNRLRGDRGLNYGDYAYVEKFVGGLGQPPFPNLNTPLRQQFFSIWLRPMPPDRTLFGIRDALFELKNLVEKGLSKEDFEQTRKFVLNYSKLWAATASRRLGYKMDSEFYGSEYYIDRIDQELKTMTVEDVNAAIKKYLNPDNIKIAVVVDEGKGQAFLSSMISNAPSPITYQSPVGQSIIDQDKLIQTFPLTINKDKSVVVNAKDLFEK